MKLLIRFRNDLLQNLIGTQLTKIFAYHILKLNLVPIKAWTIEAPCNISQDSIIFKVTNCLTPAQLSTWRTTLCRLSKTAYSVYWHLFSISGAHIQPQSEVEPCHGDKGYIYVEYKNIKTKEMCIWKMCIAHVGVHISTSASPGTASPHSSWLKLFTITFCFAREDKNINKYF